MCILLFVFLTSLEISSISSSSSSSNKLYELKITKTIETKNIYIFKEQKK